MYKKFWCHSYKCLALFLAVDNFCGMDAYLSDLGWSLPQIFVFKEGQNNEPILSTSVPAVLESNGGMEELSVTQCSPPYVRTFSQNTCKKGDSSNYNHNVSAVLGDVL